MWASTGVAGMRWLGQRYQQAWPSTVIHENDLLNKETARKLKWTNTVESFKKGGKINSLAH